jgi:hypothetical protein
MIKGQFSRLQWESFKDGLNTLSKSLLTICKRTSLQRYLLTILLFKHVSEGIFLLSSIHSNSRTNNSNINRMSSDELLPPTVEADTSPAIEKAPSAIEHATSSVTLATTTATVATAVAAATAAAEVEATAATTPPPSPSSAGTSAASSPSSEAMDTEVEAPVIEHTLTIPQASTVTPIAPAPTPAPLADKHLLTFPEHLKRILNGFYTVNMRRSVQTCVLVEADRCLKMQYRRLKAFQRKVALHDTASDLVDTLSFIPPHQRLEIMYRTATSRVILSPELTWRRMKLIDREIKKNIIPKVMQLSEPGKTHDEICKLYLQKEYVSFYSCIFLF